MLDMNANEHVTPERIDAAFRAQRERLPYGTGTPASVRVLLPTLELGGWSGWLCKVCLRVPLPNRRPWSWFGCGPCRRADARLASRLGGKRFLPLGQHSIMNGLGIRLADSSPMRVRAAHDQMVAMGREWQVLEGWRDHLASTTAQQWLDERGGGATVVPLSEWQARYPAGRLASGISYSGLLERHYPWILDVAPEAADARWLSGGGL